MFLTSSAAFLSTLPFAAESLAAAAATAMAALHRPAARVGQAPKRQRRGKNRTIRWAFGLTSRDEIVRLGDDSGGTEETPERTRQREGGGGGGHPHPPRNRGICLLFPARCSVTSEWLCACGWVWSGAFWAGRSAEVLCEKYPFLESPCLSTQMRPPPR